ncbi:MULTISPECIES: MmgE/PrpD family protein [unclassified Amycolatopsis]|uniref:MmgE/PrpD family protein n=1 Tax=unclassified Amycolatopsis TaxID=2618356 RepID=UPI003453908B
MVSDGSTNGGPTEASADVVGQLARAVATTSWDTVPAAAQVSALDLLLDSVAVMAAGSAHPDMRALRGSVAPAAGPSTVFGESRGAGVQDAVLLNGATISVLQRQDGYSRMKGHPAIQVAAVLLGLGEERQVGAREFLNAFVGGYELAARIGLGIGGVPGHLHDIGNWVTVGAAGAATSLVSGADDRAVAAGIDGAASLGLHFDRWTTTSGATLHHLYPATACTTALNVARGAAAGLTARPGALSSFYGPFLAEDFHAEAMLDGVADGTWASYEIVNGYFKLHPSCAHLHGVNDAVSALLAEERFGEDDVRRVDVRIFDEGMAIDCAEPKNDLDARFSARATVAAAIRFGALDDEGLLDLGTLRPLMDRISVSHDPELDVHKPTGRAGTVRVELGNGRVVSRTVIHPRGTPEVPVTDEERLAKATSLLSRVYGAAGAERVREEIYALPRTKSLHALTESLRTTQTQ